MTAENKTVPAPDFDARPVRLPAVADTTIDRRQFAPFMLIDGRLASLLLFDSHFEPKAGIFREQPGWCGNGRDWHAVAQQLIAEQLPESAGKFTFDSDASLFSVAGEKAEVSKLAGTLKMVFDDESLLRDILRRASLPGTGGRHGIMP